MQVDTPVEQSQTKQNTLLKTATIYVFVFVSGFISLASEIIGPRLFASLFGTTTIIWAIMISVSLGGLSIGYYLGGRLSLRRAKQALPIVLILNALWLLAASWLIWELPAQLSNLNIEGIALTAVAAFLVPFILFGMISPLSIILLSEGRTPPQITRIVGNIYALSTVGSVLGALVAAFSLIPWVGLSASLRLFAVVFVLFASYFWAAGYRQVVANIVLVACLEIPQPSYQWNDSEVLLTQREGYFQTIRVYSDQQKSYITFHLGPTYESEVETDTMEPAFGYARTMVTLAGDVTGKRILSIGGAGHSMARALEKRGATVTEVEIDPVVIEVSDQFFGPIKHVVNQDGRAYVEQADPGTYDYIFVDAYNGPASVPVQLTTLEFFQAVRRALKPDGRMMYNFIGTPNGPASNSFHAMAATISAAFANAYASTDSGIGNQNIIFVASQADVSDLGYVKAPADGRVLTDDQNPIEIYLEEARQGYIAFRR